jgi:hypothetical protein
MDRFADMTIPDYVAFGVLIVLFIVNVIACLPAATAQPVSAVDKSKPPRKNALVPRGDQTNV